LLPDFPNGTGFSETNAYDTSLEDLQASELEFFDILSSENTPNSKQINFKSRKILMYGVSYGCALLTLLGTKMLANGYNIQGLYLESPFMDQRIFAKKLPEQLRDFHLQAGPGLKKWSAHAKTCLSNMENQSTRKFTYQDAEFCDQMYSEPLKNQSGVELVNGTDMRCSQKSFLDSYLSRGVALWQSGKIFFSKTESENTRKVFGANRQALALNMNVYQNLLYNTFTENFDQFVGELLEKQIPISITVGNWDIMCNHRVTETWLAKLSFFRGCNGAQGCEPREFDDREWSYDEFGKFKDWGLLRYEVVEEAGHIIGLQTPKVSYEKLRDLVEVYQTVKQ
jgi:carboxypeptidase C (cathepsin A)